MFRLFAHLILVFGLWIAGGGWVALAQTNLAFFDKWELLGRPEPYYLQLKDGWMVEADFASKYQVIRDLGDRVVLLVWPAPSEEMDKARYPIAYTFVTLTLEPWKTMGDGEDWQYLQYGYCGVGRCGADDFSIHDMDKLWQELLDGSQGCGLHKNDWKLRDGWSVLYFLRTRPTPETPKPTPVTFDPAFLDRWQLPGRTPPYHLQIKGDTIIEPDLVRKYQLVRDLGKRIVLLVWPSQSQTLEKAHYPIAYTFVTLTLKPREPIGAGTERQYLEYGYCGVGTRGMDDFSIHDMGALWQDLLGGARGCGLEEDGWAFGKGWRQITFIGTRQTGGGSRP